MSSPLHHNLVVFSSETEESKRLALKVCGHLDVPLSSAKIHRYNDDESQPHLEVSVANKTCVIVTCLHQTTSRNSNDNIMVLLQMCRAMYASQASEIIIFAPYTAMARQDKPDDKRSCIGIGLLPDILKAAAKTIPVRYITFDLHAGQISTVFQTAGIRIDNLHSEPHIISYCQNYLIKHLLSHNKTNELVVVAPDAGAAKRAERISSDDYGLGAGCALMHKTRSCAGEVASVKLNGDVNGKIALMVDDMCDTGGTVIKAAEKLKEEGAEMVVALFCHGVFSKNALQRLSDSKAVDIVVTTNTCDKLYELVDYKVEGKDDNIEFGLIKEYPKFTIIDISWLGAEAIRRRVGNESVSELFDSKATSDKQLHSINKRKRQENYETNYEAETKKYKSDAPKYNYLPDMAKGMVMFSSQTFNVE